MINSQTSWNMEYHLASCINIGNLNVPEVFGHVFLKEYLQVQSWKIPPGFIQICKKQLYQIWPMEANHPLYRTQENMTLQNGETWNRTGTFLFNVTAIAFEKIEATWRSVRMKWWMKWQTNTDLRASFLALNMFSLKQWRKKKNTQWWYLMCGWWIQVLSNDSCVVNGYKSFQKLIYDDTTITMQPGIFWYTYDIWCIYVYL